MDEWVKGKGSVDIDLVWVMMFKSPRIQTVVTTDANGLATIIGLSKVERMLVRTFPPIMEV